MVETQTQPSATAFSLHNWHILARILTGIYLLIMSMGVLSLPFLNAQWFSRPSLGALFLPDMRVSAILIPASSPTLPATSALQVGDCLIRLDGVATPNGAALLEALSNRAPGKEVFLSVLNRQGEMVTRIQVLQTWQPGWRLIYGEVPTLLGAVALLLAWLVFLRFGQTESGRATAMLAASLGFILGGSSDLLSTHTLVPLWVLALGMATAAQFDLSLSFAAGALPWSDLEKKRRTAYFTAAALVFGLYLLLTRDALRFSPLVWRGLFLVHAASALASGIVLVVYAHRSQTPLERTRALVLLATLALTFPSLGEWLGGLLFSLKAIARVAVILPALTLALPLAAAVILFSTVRFAAQRYVFIRTILDGLLALGYALLATGLTFLVGGSLITSRPLTLSGIFVFLALSLLPLYRALEKYLEAVLFQSDKALTERLNTLMRELTRAIDLPHILTLVRKAVNETLHPKILHIYLHDPTSDDYIATADESGRPSSDLRFGRTSALVQTLSQQSSMLYVANPTRLSATLYGEQARLALLGAQVYFPLKVQQHLAGWIALGPRASGQPYTTREYTFVSALADQVSLAVERSRVINDLNQRVRQMNVLIRVAQGVNITRTMEDMYELVYAQTSQIVPADAFQLLLYDGEKDALRVVFDVLRDERLNQRENPLVSLDTSLEGIILRQRKAILTDDYTRECRARGILIPQADLYAWMGVPLNAGAETIGVLALGSLNPEVHYTREQLDLLQAIADQTAGAIVKARLLDEAERRARQLKMLNDVTQKLSSTLALEPLLQSILENAAEILACEAGSLLLWDEPSNELVCRVVLGPVARYLLDQRMPSDKGLAGKTFQTRTPQIVNDVSTSPEWFRLPDEMTGFTTRAVLAVPLVVKERAIGVLEVVNRKDGKGFTSEDADLLSTFAAQAAIAIENARLYTMTDQALAARIEELSVMQRIDRELNATLDLHQTMGITLHWALRRSAAPAGLIGLLEDNALQPVAWQGLPETTVPDASALSRQLPLRSLRESGKPLKRTLAEEAAVLLENARVQVLLPIFREKGISALLVLESPDPAFCPDELMDFLQRLCDHAAIALANAQLYAAVRSANLAKSEFVSFVAHELKNPMTSIKGYTELLIAGAVGPVNEAQANFLSVIRSNVDRMNILVSDLNDLSKIEAGRMRLEFAPLTLSEIVAEVERSMRRQIEEKQQQLHINLPADLPPVWADRTRLIQILVNLVSNAHKYTDPGGHIILGAERTFNRWDAAGARDVVHIWVQDTGIGIAPEDQPRIFQKFFRSEDPKTREVPGTGLGLNITRSLVEMQGGKIWFESEYRKGTTFHFTVPVAETA